MTITTVADGGEGLVRSPLSTIHDREALVEAFLAQPEDRRFVFGTGEIARGLARATAAGALLDDYRIGDVVDGRPVLDPARATGLIVANGVSGVRPRSASDRIRRAGGIPVDHLAFVAAGLPGVAFPVIGDGFAEEFESHRSTYGAILQRLADPESRETFAAIVNTRLHRDVGFMSAFQDRQDRQYFEPFLGLRSDGEVFADVGSFDGATSRQFAERFPGYRHIHALEPSQTLAARVRADLTVVRDVTVHEVGAGERDETVAFASSGSASRIDAGGIDRVTVRRLDGLLDPEPTFIKMDIEGHEIPALRGAADQIARNRPVLAVCCYHRVEDLRTIVETVDEISDFYQLFLRHYTEGLTESVYFFVPR